jgi:prepilin-type N-terminal cleavage/methylation domain-containing protein
VYDNPDMNLIHRTRQPSTRAFTLIELLVVIAIIGMLAAFLFPAIRNAMREAQAARCRKQIGQVLAGLLQYKDDNDLFFPGKTLLKDAGSASKSLAGGSLGGGDVTLDKDRALYTYVRDPEVFRCGSDRGSVAPPAATTEFSDQFGSSYLYAGENNSATGILGLFGGKDKGRKYTDPYLGASSLKIIFYEPTFFGAPGKVEPKLQWHDANRATMAAFLDGHSEKVKADSVKTVWDGPDAETALENLRLSKRVYY